MFCSFRLPTSCAVFIISIKMMPQGGSMGEQNIVENANESSRQDFMKALLEEVRALEAMLEEGMVESGVSRIGAEQEMFDKQRKPAGTDRS